MSHNEQVAHYARVARGKKAERYGKPVISSENGEWSLTTIHPANGSEPMPYEMYQAYVDRLNGVDTTAQLGECFSRICNIVNELVGRDQRLEVVKVLAQYRVKKVVDLPREWYPALLYDLKQLLKEFRS